MGLQRIAVVATACLAAFCLTSRAFSADLQGVEAFPLDQLKAGMKATGLTVIRGTQIQSFDVEILEVVPKGGYDGNAMILAKFSGPVVEQSNGIAGGYSGSPVYINGKLVGAVSMAIPYSDTHVGGITPISSMLAALPDHQEVDFSGNTVLPGSTKSGTPIDEDGNVISYVTDQQQAKRQNEAWRAAGVHRFAAVKTATPVYCSGISPEVLSRFKPQLSRLFGDNFEVQDRPVGSGAEVAKAREADASSGSAGAPGLLLLDNKPAPPLKPGDAIAVSLMQGDIDMNAIGTVTYSDESGRFLCFGHPMLAVGDTNMPIGKGYITWTHKSVERAFKDGVRINSLGTLMQDRAAACGGVFNSTPDVVPVKVKIKDIDLGTSKTVNFEVIRHPDFTPILVAMGMSQAAAQILDRQPGGTLKVSYMIEGAGLKEPLRRTNYFSDDADVIFSSALEVLPITNLLQTNIYRDVKISRIEVMLEITRNRINASIDDAKIVWDKKQAPAVAAPTAPAAGGATAPAEEGAKDGGTGGEKAEGITFFGSSEAYRRYWADTSNRASGQRLQSLAESLLAAEGQTPPEGPPQPETPQQQPQQAGPPSLGPMMPPMSSPDIPTFSPGEEIRVRVRLQPYRTDPVWREFSIKVPADFPSGSTTILVHGGGDLISPSELTGKGRSLFGMGPIIDVKEHDLDSVLNQIMDWPLNNQLLVTLVRPYDPAAPQELGVAGEAEKPDQKVDEKYQMEWVVYNGFMLPVNIIGQAAKDQQAQAAAGTTATGTAGATAPTAAEGDGAGAGDEGDSELPFETSSSVWDQLRMPEAYSTPQPTAWF